MSIRVVKWTHSHLNRESQKDPKEEWYVKRKSQYWQAFLELFLCAHGKQATENYALVVLVFD